MAFLLFLPLLSGHPLQAATIHIGWTVFNLSSQGGWARNGQVCVWHCLKWFQTIVSGTMLLKINLVFPLIQTQILNGTMLNITKLSIHVSPTLPTWDSNPQPLCYQSIARVMQRLWVWILFKAWFFSGHFSSSVMAAFASFIIPNE